MFLRFHIPSIMLKGYKDQDFKDLNSYFVQVPQLDTRLLLTTIQLLLLY